MKKLLLISYYFPPLGMGGTQRAVKFAKYLPQFGWQATVLTVKPIAYWAEDASLLQEIADVPIVRTGSLDPQRLLRLFKYGKAAVAFGNDDAAKASGAQPTGDGRTFASMGAKRSRWFSLMNNKILPLFLLPDSKILWRWHAESAARRLLQSAPFAAILTTSPPHSSHLIGRSLARTFGLPWIADFRDAWSGGVVVHEPTRWHRYLQKRIQNRILAAADAVTCVSQGICEELSLHCRQREKFHLLPNGFDPADYPRPQKPADDSSFVFCHCGSITHFSDPLPIFKTLQQMRQLEPDIFQRLKFIFVGYDALGHFAEMITSHRLTDTISYFGYQPHHQALAMLTQADALLLVACHPSNAHFIPGKTYEYLGAKKPILAVSNVADTVQFLQRFPWVTICSPEKPQQLIGAIKKIVMAQKPPIDDDLLRPYDRVYQTQQLAEILHGLIRR